MFIVTAHYEPGKDRYSMRLNGKRIVEVMEEKSLTEEMICSRTPGGMRDSGRESGRQLVRTYPGCMDKDKSDTAAYRRTEGAESGNHAPELSEMTVIIGVRGGKTGLKWRKGRNIRVGG